MTSHTSTARRLDRPRRATTWLALPSALLTGPVVTWWFVRAALATQASMSLEDLLLQALCAAGALLCAWMTLGSALCALALLPGHLGRLAEDCSRRVAPTAVRRMAGLALGATVATGVAPLPAHASLPDRDAGPVATETHGSPANAGETSSGTYGSPTPSSDDAPPPRSEVPAPRDGDGSVPDANPLVQPTSPTGPRATASGTRTGDLKPTHDSAASAPRRGAGPGRMTADVSGHSAHGPAELRARTDRDSASGRGVRTGTLPEAPRSTPVGMAAPMVTPGPPDTAPQVAAPPLAGLEHMRATPTAGSFTSAPRPATPPDPRLVATPSRDGDATAAGSAERRPGSGAGTGATEARPATAREVVVHRGDCLTSIVARHLGLDPASEAARAAIRQWHAVNRDVIGPDPDRLLPGQVLRPPSPPSELEL